MALATINGKVIDVKRGSYGTGLKINEEITAGDKSFSRSWMAWFAEDPNIAVGASVTVSGALLVKLARDGQTKELRTYTDKTTGEQVPYLDWSLNNAVIDPAW